MENYCQSKYRLKYLKFGKALKYAYHVKEYSTQILFNQGRSRVQISPMIQLVRNEIIFYKFDLRFWCENIGLFDPRASTHHLILLY